jgi:hypothetical protein
MKKEHLVIMGVAVLAGGLLWAAQGQTTEWEYASFSYVYGSPSRAVRWNWTSPGMYADAATIDELGRKMGVAFPGGAAPTELANHFAVINWAGSMGWELVTMEAMDAEYTIAAWFKREQ